MPYRLLSYMVQLWARCIEDAGESARRKSFLLPPIVPVVFYEGEDAWTAAKRFTEKVRGADSFRGYVPEFEYRLISLRDEDSEDLLSKPDALSSLMYLAQPFKSEDFFEVSERIRNLLLAFPEEFFEQKGAEGMLTYLEKEIRRYKKQGREEGRQEGREEGQLEKGISIALAMLGNGEPEDKILLYTGFTPEQLAEIREGRLRRE